MALPERHAEISADFIARAEILILAGDRLQASEKAWGAVAHCIKSIAERRNWLHGSHAALSIIKTRLAHETDDPDRVIYLYDRVELLHSNFYEDWFKQEYVEDRVRDARELITRLAVLA